MFNSIEYNVTFATTGRILSEKLNFQTGFGTITGPNEAGKSMVIEMARWALFGVSALRGTASEMKKAKVKLDFTVKGQRYKVERTPTNAKLFKDDIEIAVGTTPVNTKVSQIFGFGLAVFDMACVANQGQVEAMASMKPTERKRAVDSVIGLGVIDDLAKTAGEEASALRRLASDLSATTREPQMPERPEGYREVAELDAELALMSKAESELNQISGWLNVTPAVPNKPVCDIAVDVDTLKDLADAQIERQTAARRAEMELNSLPAASPYSDEELEAFEGQNHEWDQCQKRVELLKNPEPKYTEDQLQEMINQLACNEEFYKANRLQQRIKALAAEGGHTCPKCSHNWAAEQEAIDQLRAELDGMDEGLISFAEVPLNASQIENEQHKIQWWNDVVVPGLAVTEMFKDATKPPATLAQIESFRERNKFTAQREALQLQVQQAQEQLGDQPDYGDMLRKRQRYDDQLQDYLVKLEAYNTWQVEAESKKARHAILTIEAEGRAATEALRHQVVVYDTMMVRFNSDMEAYMETMKTVQATQEQVADWEKAKVALTDLRGLVKQHLMPSLNKVASFYLHLMTGGQRQHVYADEDFNISIDGQPIHTLSGSGKAVACLALRMGLGQVLTNGVFSVFVGDEIDASMDKDRAENTALTLQTLKGRVSQILLITHKFPTADYYIKVGNTNVESEELVA